MHIYLAKYKNFLKQGGAALTPKTYLHINFDRKGAEIGAIHGSPKYTFFYEKKGCPLVATRNHIFL